VASLAAAVVGSRVPARALTHDGPITRPRQWEHGGRTYERFGIRRWKSHLPDAGALFAATGKRHLPGFDRDALAAFAAETRRGELVHWASAAVVITFPLWNPMPLALAAAVLWVAGNLPCIAAQRYNRARIGRLLSRPAVTASRRAEPAPGPAAPDRSVGP
jgi:glycosyl-4,4'-diaponeurosporenoate acyltransferase